MDNVLKRNKTKVIVGLLIILCLTYIYVFDPFIELVRVYPTGLSDFRDTGSYKIDPQTILGSLDRGETAVFMPEMATPDAPAFEEPISWQQSDYLKIARALHEFVWQESLDDWNLYYVDFISACHDSPSGFALGDFYYFKTILRNDGKLRYTARELLISPQYGHVIWGGRATFPHPLMGWKSVNLDQVKITAEDALRIAEENGGEAIRLSVKNECKIQVRLAGNAPEWRVIITTYDTASEIFRLEINPYTGEIQ